MKAIIAAVDKDWGIGKDGKIPWYFPEDFAWFKEQTKGAVVIMGYKTFAEIAEKFKFASTGKLLPGRISYVISTRDIPTTDTVKTGFTSIKSAIKDAEENYPDRNIFLIGGAKIFEEGMELIDTIFLTRIPDTYDCDVFFPEKALKENDFIPILGEFKDIEIGTDPNLHLSFWIYKKK